MAGFRNLSGCTPQDSILGSDLEQKLAEVDRLERAVADLKKMNQSMQAWRNSCPVRHEWRCGSRPNRQQRWLRFADTDERHELDTSTPRPLDPMTMYISSYYYSVRVGPYG
jgi:hypothetical protein